MSYTDTDFSEMVNEEMDLKLLDLFKQFLGVQNLVVSGLKAKEQIVDNFCEIAKEKLLSADWGEFEIK